MGYPAYVAADEKRREKGVRSTRAVALLHFLAYDYF
jgi:hypothetical protein